MMPDSEAWLGGRLPLLTDPSGECTRHYGTGWARRWGAGPARSASPAKPSYGAQMVGILDGSK